MGKDPQQTDLYGEHVGLLDEVVGRAGRYLEIESGQLDSKWDIRRRLISKIKTDRWLDGFDSARRMQVHLQDKVRVRLQHPGQTVGRQRRPFARLPSQELSSGHDHAFRQIHAVKARRALLFRKAPRLPGLIEYMGRMMLHFGVSR